MKKIFLLSIFFICASVFGQENYQEKYLELLKANKMPELLTLLQSWEENDAQNPELYIAYFNYYIKLDSESYTQLGQMPDGRHGMYPETKYNTKNVNRGIEYLNKGLEIAPDRLDIYLGKCSSLGKTNQLSLLRDSIISLLDTYKNNQYDWKWSMGKSIKDLGGNFEQVVVASIMDYLSLHFMDYSTGNYLKSELNKVLDILEAEIAVFPDNVMVLNCLALYYDNVGEKDKSIEVIKKALDLNPKDEILKTNLAVTYEEMNKIELAKKLFKELIESNNPDVKRTAEAGLKRIESGNTNR